MDEPSNIPDEVIKEYKRAIARAKGNDYASATKVRYSNGWFRVEHPNGTESSYRRRQIQFHTEKLLATNPDSYAYEKLINVREAAAAAELAAAQRARCNSLRGSGLYPRRSSWTRRAMTVVWIAGICTWICIWQIEKKVAAERIAEQEAKKEAERAAIMDAHSARKTYQRAHNSEFRSSGSSRSSEYKTALGSVFIGTKLYRKSDHVFFGIITDVDVDAGRVEVALTDSVSVGSQRTTGYAVWYDRSYVTKNFVVKR